MKRRAFANTGNDHNHEIIMQATNKPFSLRQANTPLRFLAEIEDMQRNRFCIATRLEFHVEAGIGGTPNQKEKMRFQGGFTL